MRSSLAIVVVAAVLTAALFGGVAVAQEWYEED